MKHDERWLAHMKEARNMDGTYSLGEDHYSKRKRAAHMAASMPDYEHTHHCIKCGAPVHIRVPQPLSVVLVLQHWHDKLDGKCRACLEKGKAVGK